MALEKTFELPHVEAKELEAIEPEIDRIMNGPGTDEEVDEKMRLAVIELYAQKAEKKTLAAAGLHAKPKAPRKPTGGKNKAGE